MHSKSKAKYWVNMILPPMITMFVSALWHGVSWNMLIWGGLHGIYQIVEHLGQKIHPQPPMNERSWWKQGMNIAGTFIFSVLAWVPFKMPLAAALAYWRSMLRWVKPDLYEYRLAIAGQIKFPPLTNSQYINIVCFVILALAILFDLAQNHQKSELFLQQWPRWAQVIVIVVLLTVIVLAAYSNNVAPFVYQTF
jgi:magnesium-transporting ATPase (P-type)